MAELVDAHALGACGATHGGSSPLPPILLRAKICIGRFAGMSSLNMYIVYILISIKDPMRYYIGVTDNLDRRLQEHNKVERGYSKRYAPWIVKTYIVFDNM